MSNREYYPMLPGKFMPTFDPTPAPGCPGLVHVGYLALQTGEVLDVYDEQPEGRPDDKPSINTTEGWQALVERLREEAREELEEELDELDRLEDKLEEDELEEGELEEDEPD